MCKQMEECGLMTRKKKTHVINLLIFKKGLQFESVGHVPYIVSGMFKVFFVYAFNIFCISVLKHCGNILTIVNKSVTRVWKIGEETPFL